MSVTMLIITAMVFTLVGFIKGVIVLGLPAVSVGLLAVAMPAGPCARHRHHAGDRH